MRHAIILLALLCVSCSSALPSVKPYRMDIQQGNVVNSKMMAQLRPGMTKSQVRFILGTPLIQDDFHTNRWDYFYQMRKDGKIVEQRRVILDFENDLLKGVRGDVVPAGSNPDAVDVTPAAAPAPAPKVEEKKGLVDKLKFWQKDAANQSANAKAQAAKPEAAVTAPEELVAPSSAALPVAAAAAVVAAETVAPQPAAKAAPVVQQPTVESVAEVAAPVAVLADATADLANPEVVESRVNAWAEAWRSKNVAAYLQFYSDKFVPDALPSKKAWVAQRKQRLAKSGAISLVLENVKVNVDGTTATAEFLQRYSTQGFSDNVSKVLTLNLERSKGNWFIVKESAVEQKAAPVAKPLAEVALPAVVAAKAAGLAKADLANSDTPLASAPTTNDSEAVAARVDAWANAWRNKDVATYLSFYADQFVPDGLPSKKAWVAQRKQRLSKPGAISLNVDGVNVRAEGNQAKVSFVQRYSANVYSDNVSKELVFQRIAGSWLIVKESVTSVLKRIDADYPADEAKTPKLTPEQKSESMPEYPAEVPPKAQETQSAPGQEQAAPVQSVPEPAPAVEEAPAKVEAKTTDDKKAAKQNKEDESLSKPSLFERMLEKIGF